MKKLNIYVFVFIFLLLNNRGYSEDNIPSSFHNYNKILIENPVFLDKSLKYEKMPNNKTQRENFGGDYYDDLLSINCKDNFYYIGYSNGLSEDPTYKILYFKNKNKYYIEINATDLYVSSECNFYASGHTNNLYNKRRKYIVSDSGFSEVKQPFYLVSQSCQTSSKAILTTEKYNKGSVVARLQKGEIVQVLVTDNEGNFLVSTPFGLVGWVKNNEGSLNSPGVPLSCIYYNGD